MTPAQLLAGAQEVAGRFPGAELVKNAAGNLAIADGGRYVGWLNLRDGEVDVLTPEQVEAFAEYDGTQAGPGPPRLLTKTPPVMAGEGSADAKVRQASEPLR
jgi:hypothetical protein